MALSSGFSLSKWYLDCVSDEGDVFVGYSASVKWKALSLEYSSILIRRTVGEIVSKSTLYGGKHPSASGGTVNWDCPALDLSGVWRGRRQSINRTVLEKSNTPLDWLCVQPHADVEVTVGELGTFKGFGYVDYLDLPSQPWKLPLDVLRWGRFLSDKDSIIWMDFEGPFQETLVFHNGVLCDDAEVTDVDVSLGEDRPRLIFDDTESLREGRLASTALSVIPGVNKVLPARMLNTEERKWRSRGILKRGNTVLGSGWTIHEVVRWPQAKSSQR